MSNGKVAEDVLPEAMIYSFAEESCFTPDARFKQIRNPVIFRVHSIGKKLGKRIDMEIVADYGVYYEPDDVYVVGILHDNIPEVPWAQFVYWRKLDQSSIEIIDPETDRPVARIHTRKYQGGPVEVQSIQAGELGENVIAFGDLARLRAERLAVQRVLEEGLDGTEA